MTIIFCDITALRIFRANRFCSFGKPLDKREARKIQEKGRFALSKRASQNLPLYGYGLAYSNDAIHVLVPKAKDKRNGERLVCHVWERDFEANMLLQLDHDTFVVTPEMLFLQLGRVLPVTNLAQVAMELCGRYELAEFRHKTTNRPLPLTTVEQLRSFIEEHPGVQGSKRARQALKYIADNSWSPMETITYLLLCLPRTMGGYGIPHPTLNERIDLPPEKELPDGTKRLYCDLYWSNHCFCIEYDGDESHFERAGIVRGNRRRAVLEDLGITVLTITHEDVFNADAFDAVSCALKQRMKLVRTPPSALMKAKRIALRKTLLFGVHT